MRDTCGHDVRGFVEPCGLEPNHKGHHSCVTFMCDGCGKIRRGLPEVTEVNSFDNVIEARLCFLCVHTNYVPKKEAISHGA